MSVADPTGALADPRVLVGTWALSRTIEDRLGDLGGVVEGRLDLVEVAPARLRWVEQGTWRRPGGEVAVRRGLWLVRREPGWWVCFEDGSDFHPWRPGGEVVHECRPDTYRGVVAGSPAGWSVTWRVGGPAKDYVMRTQLRPVDLREEDDGPQQEGADLSGAAGPSGARRPGGSPRRAGS